MDRIEEPIARGYEMRKIFLAAVMLIGIVAPTQSVAAQDFYQLRTYEMLPASKERFHTRFKDHALRIMMRHGFDVAAIWEADRQGSPEFVYLLRWRSEEQMNKAWEAFLADEEWIRIKRATAQPNAPIMGKIDSKIMHLTGYSPGHP
jgi:heme-degrading monooxygenase HmoA